MPSVPIIVCGLETGCLALTGTETLEYEIIRPGAIRAKYKLADFGKTAFRGYQASSCPIAKDRSVAFVFRVEILRVSLRCQEQYVFGQTSCKKAFCRCKAIYTTRAA